MFKLEFASTSYDDESLQMMQDRLSILSQSLSRKKVRQDCQLWLKKISQKIDHRRQKKEARERHSLFVAQAAQVKKFNSKKADIDNVNEAWNEFEDGVFPWNQGKVDEAIPAFKRAIEIAKKDEDAQDFAQAYSFLADAYFWIGITMYEKGNLKEAITTCEKSVLIEPIKNPGAYNILGLSLLEKGNLVEAISVFKKLIEVDSDYSPGYYNLGMALAENNELDQAIAALKKAREVYVKQGDVQKVEEINKLLTNTGFE
jgi:tetratricopeptide (TPR) repeat protein